MKHLFINILIQDGDRRTFHPVLIETKCENLEFAAQYYIAHFGGYGELISGWWEYYNGVYAAKCYDWKEVPKNEYKILRKYL